MSICRNIKVAHWMMSKKKNSILIITLSADAQYRALWMQQEKTWPNNPPVENWIIPNPTDTFGPRDMRIASYRSIRSLLATKIKERFVKF